MDADSIVAEIMAYCQINSHDARELARLIIARLASADAYETGKQAGIDRCIDVLRGNLLAGYGPDAKAQRDADIAILGAEKDGAASLPPSAHDELVEALKGTAKQLAAPQSVVARLRDIGPAVGAEAADLIEELAEALGAYMALSTEWEAYFPVESMAGAQCGAMYEKARRALVGNKL